MDMTTIPLAAQGMARTLLTIKALDEVVIARANERVAVNCTLIQWITELLRVAEGVSDAQHLAQQLSGAWQIRRVSQQEWQAYNQQTLQNLPALPKGLNDAPQGVVLLGNLGAGVPKLGILDASDAQALQRLAFVFHESFEWRLLSLDEFLQIQSRRHHRQVDAPNTPPPTNKRGQAKNLDNQDAPVVRYIQELLARLVTERASDVHFEPFAKDFRIRARVDGVLREVARPDSEMREQLTVRLKILAQMDIAEKRLPQDGRIRLTIRENKGRDRPIDCRVSTLPTIFGEKIVVRFLNSQDTSLNINTLGFEPDQLRIVEATLKHPHGMILMTGPTGSGKTVSLYTCLNQLNNDSVNISTVEDPVEIFLDGINQVSINEKAGIQFVNVLRAFLRQDPDILMVGEIRDLETADISIKAAQTGHLVLSTLHTNSATLALTRLLQMGVTPYNVAASVTLIMAQRLIRTLCSCKQATTIDAHLLRSAGMNEMDAQQNQWQAYTAKGCPRCHNTGYTGRTGIFQTVPVSEAMQTLIARNASAQEMEQQAAKEGHITLRAAGLRKVMAGVTTIEEVMVATI